MRTRTSRIALIAVAAFLLPSVVGFAILFTILQRRADPVPFDPRVRHLVTPAMLTLTERMATKPAPGFELPGSDGRTHTLVELTAKGPVLITFVNLECPCSRDAQPMYNALAEAYPRLSTVGIVGATPAAAWKWGADQKAAHLLLADPKFGAMRAYGAVSSVYTVLVTPGGKIVKMWPGYSQGMMAEVSAKVADLLGVPAARLNPALAPKEMAAGCTFPLR